MKGAHRKTSTQRYAMLDWLQTRGLSPYSRADLRQWFKYGATDAWKR